MAIKELLQAIAAKLPEEMAAEKAQIAGAIREVDSIYDDLKSANAESKSRKEKIRELQSELENKADFSETEKKLKAEIERLKTVETEYNTVKTAEQQKIVNTWKEKSKVFEVEKTAKNFDKISKLKEKFAFPEGDIDFETASKNLEKYELLESAGAFEVADTKTPNWTPPKQNNGSDIPESSGQALLKISKK